MHERGKAGAAERAVALIGRTAKALPAGPWLVAVSGGRDSIALLDACAAWRRAEVAAVATFDHGTSAAAARAVERVELEAMKRGVPVVSGRAAAAATDEASWRAARWDFLNHWAEEFRARVITAHTRDDQAETVFMRILRGAGARGLAAMRAPSRVLRPFLEVSRADVAAFARARALEWTEDPSNARPDHFRNRVRLELLPAFERAKPGFTDWLVSLGERAAAVRTGVAATVDGLLGDRSPADGAPVVVPSAALAGFAPEELAVLWPEIAARAGVALDWRGLERLVRETARLRPGGTVPLAGGASVARTVSSFVVRNRGASARLY